MWLFLCVCVEILSRCTAALCGLSCSGGSTAVPGGRLRRLGGVMMFQNSYYTIRQCDYDYFALVHCVSMTLKITNNPNMPIKKP